MFKMGHKEGCIIMVSQTMMGITVICLYQIIMVCDTIISRYHLRASTHNVYKCLSKTSQLSNRILHIFLQVVARLLQYPVTVIKSYSELVILQGISIWKTRGLDLDIDPTKQRQNQETYCFTLNIVRCLIRSTPPPSSSLYSSQHLLFLTTRYQTKLLQDPVLMNR